MSSRSLIAWSEVDPRLLEAARLSLPKSEQPSYHAVVAVGQILATLQSAHKGYCDSTIPQIRSALKGAFGEEVIKNALRALEKAGVIFTVKGGTKSAKGGRGAWRVFVRADEKNLIPEGYAPPTLEDFLGSHDLPSELENCRVENELSEVDREPFSGSPDLPTPKEFLYLSTPPLGEAETNNSLKRESDTDSTLPNGNKCELCNASEIDEQHELVARVVNAMSCRNASASAQKARKSARTRAVPLLNHLRHLGLPKVAELLDQMSTHIGLPHDRLLQKAEELLASTPESE